MGKNAQRRRRVRDEAKRTATGRAVRFGESLQRVRSEGSLIPNRTFRRGNQTHGKRTTG